MWPKRMPKLAQLESALKAFSKDQIKLPGLAAKNSASTLAMQMVASLRRLDYTSIMRARPVDPRRADPAHDMFDPERAAIFHAQQGNFDEAVWVLFLATHFGKHGRTGWKRLRDLYSGLGSNLWTWQRVSNDLPSFRAWLKANESKIGGAFGNHRKYESLNAERPTGTGAVVASYVDWIGPSRSHSKKFADLIHQGGNDPHSIYDLFYHDMQVARFGRLGKFDFLCLVGRHDLAPISPGSAYLTGATGPLRGARLLFGGEQRAAIDVATLESGVRELDAVLQVGMQVMEDSLCNWQKSPMRFIHFRS